jgi:hypothetical protein
MLSLVDGRDEVRVSTMKLTPVMALNGEHHVVTRSIADEIDGFEQKTDEELKSLRDNGEVTVPTDDPPVPVPIP